jgi:hypothetical protein
MSDTEAPPQKRKVSDKQLENLRKGMAKLKEKREALAKEKQEVVSKIEKGELPEDTPLPKNKQKPRNSFTSKPIPKPAEPVVVEPEVKPVKPRKTHVSKVAQQLDAFKSEMMAMVQKPVEVKEVVVEKPVERIIQKERVVSGSELLNKIFNL